ncbi:ankyrin repeat protein [Seminavis robusta]|uniref:Ankyrin repeat protein n=1 Tax=Seminavis robusta TaxID=568900 RepID=A0A9N8HEN6_9STRA|nr:ankyrin repeat protein [Seminavis robusta]|eukprot:Sro312_g114550.1 ankyrin repeat protein (496) ;mRNA; r:24647-26134
MTSLAASTIALMSFILPLIRKKPKAPADEAVEETTPPPIDKLLRRKEIWVDEIFPFLGIGHYGYVAPVNKKMKEYYLEYCDSVKNPPLASYEFRSGEDGHLYGWEIRRPATSTSTFSSAVFYNVSCAEYWYQDKDGHNTMGDELAKLIASAGNVQVLKWADTKKGLVKWDEFDFDKAAKNGHFKVLKWANENRILIDSSFVYYGIVDGAAAGGHWELLKWCREIGYPWSESTCASAAGGGQMKILMWLRVNGCPWDSKTCAQAARNGHFEILKWSRENGCPWDSSTCREAARGGHFEILKWARENGCSWDSQMCRSAAEGGHLEILKWIRENDCPWNKGTCQGAADGGHLETIKWARENGCPWDDKTLWNVFHGAAEYGHIETLKWAFENGCYLDNCALEAAFITAIHLGQLECVKWLRENGCPWYEDSCWTAANWGHLDILRWARANGCAESDEDKKENDAYVLISRRSKTGGCQNAARKLATAAARARQLLRS